MATPLRIGLTARLMYPDPARTVLPAKTVQYAEENAANWLVLGGALVLMIPRISETAMRSPNVVSYPDYAEALDGLVLQGGSDISPQTYGENALHPAWVGDRLRDKYELAVYREFRRLRKPVLGICRGCQLINVAEGGSLYQDLGTQVPASAHHRHEQRYDANVHEATIEPGSHLAQLHGPTKRIQVNSIHHQAIKTLGKNLTVEAWSYPDGLIEAVRGAGVDYLVGVQWHPEFPGPAGSRLVDDAPLRAEFLNACEKRRAENAAKTTASVSQNA
ncbi:MAG: hypothetical protein JWM32_2159 [Verrucomicrobia bacterium]|nr:hypothetical protein [Verrucomicrobiota bacterium]